jgi:hypothetical protein
MEFLFLRIGELLIVSFSVMDYSSLGLDMMIIFSFTYCFYSYA